MIVGLTLFVAFLVICYFYLTKNYNYWKKRGVDGPEPKIFFGTYPSIYNKKRLLKDEIEKIYHDYKGKQKVVGVYRAAQPVLMLLDPMLIKSVMITHFSHFYNNAHIFVSIDKETDPLAGRNPFFLKGEEWKEKRAEITPAFSSGRMKALFPVMQAICERMKDYIERAMENDGFIESRELCAKYTTDVVCNAIYGIDSGAFTEEKSELREIARNVLQPSWQLFLMTAIAPNFPLIEKLIKVRFVPENYSNQLISLMNQTIQYRKEKNIERQDFIDYLIHLREKKGISDVETAAHTVTFFFDGIETSSITMSYVFYELAKNKMIQEKLRQELLEIRNKDKTFDYENVVDHKYLDQIIMETMRLYPVIAETGRECTEDFEVEIGDGKKLTIEKGISVSFPLCEIFKDPEYYGPTADIFDPDRFNEENGGIKAYRDKGVLFPFGDGPRVCLGQRFAQTQMKCCIANMVTSFDISLSDKMPAKPEFNPMEIMLCFKSGILLKYRPLKN